VVTGGELNAQRLDFALMAQIAQRLPLGDGAPAAGGTRAAGRADRASARNGRGRWTRRAATA
jgi:hypothetical protein